jgi:hypothetical protein
LYFVQPDFAECVMVGQAASVIHWDDHNSDCALLLLSYLPLQLEVTTGRIAMIGIVGLILNEAYFARPFFPHLF